MQAGLYVNISAQVALDKRVTTIAANIANQSTPGYRGEEIQVSRLQSRRPSGRLRLPGRILHFTPPRRARQNRQPA
jgi:flagellar basal-body rod protein FlgF